MQICLNDKIFSILSDVVTEEKLEAWVIGGYVRDLLLERNHPDKDIDILVLGNGIDLAKKVAKKLGPGIKVSIFKNFGTAMLRHGEYELEFVGARKNRMTGIKKPTVESGTLEDDQRSGISPLTLLH
jgi:poly(A) polymerase